MQTYSRLKTNFCVTNKVVFSGI